MPVPNTDPHPKAVPSADPVLLKRDGTVLLPDGRRLGYAEYGDHGGPPVLYFHGYPSSRLEAGLIPVRGVRLIAVDRPGYGLSDPLHGRRLVDWPRDVAGLMDSLGLDRAWLVGMSGGGPFACAAARFLPDRIAALALVCAMAPADDGWARNSPAGFLMSVGSRPLALRLAATAARGVIHGGDPASMAQMMQRAMGYPARDFAWIDARAAQQIVAGWREALRTGVEGPVADAAVYGAPWGFDPAEISRPVFVWHGSADRTVPVGAAHTYARLIPGSTLRIMEGEGHFSLPVRHHRDILASLVAAGVA